MKWFVLLAALIAVCGCESEERQVAAPPAGERPAQEPKPAEGESVRPMVAAGRFYPADAAQLRRMVEGYIKDAGKIEVEGEPVALIAPHAGYVYSGHVAGHAYAAVRGMSFDTVVVMGSHAPGEGISVLDVDWYRTPLGYVRVDREAVKELLEIPYFEYEASRHRDHAVEVQVPFLQAALREGFKIVSLAVNDSCADFAHKIAHDMAHALEGKKVLFVASTDLSHYPPYESAKEIDGEIMETWKTLDGAEIVRRERELMKEHADVPNLGCVMCGKASVAVAAEAAKNLGAHSIELVKYANSGDVADGDKEQVVGYGAAVIFRKGGKVETGGLSKEAQEYLLKVASEAITAAVAGGKKPSLEAQTDELKAKLGIFVTLYRNGQLRGCIGCFDSEEELPATVAKYAVYSALHDSRFGPVQEKELADLKIKISVLSAPRKIGSADEVVVGTHGIWVRDPKTGRSGTYLPEVATEMGWDRDTFLTDCCLHKAGLPGDAWKKGEVEISTYTTQVFGEK